MLPQSSLNQLPRLNPEEIHMKKYEVLYRSFIPATYQIQNMYINLKENKVQSIMKSQLYNDSSELLADYITAKLLKFQSCAVIG